MEALLSYQFYPIMKNIIEHMDYKTLQTCLLEFEDIKNLATIRLNIFKEEFANMCTRIDNFSEEDLRYFVKTFSIEDYHLWREICLIHNLSFSFIKEFKDFVDWKVLIETGKIPNQYFYFIMTNYKTQIDDSYNIWQTITEFIPHLYCDYNYEGFIVNEYYDTIDNINDYSDLFIFKLLNDV